jgi:UDP-glucose:(heptosyl)LPS alpha-1,3-glucosyltransferase
MKEPMAKVAIVLRKYNAFGGYERQAILLARELIKTGHKVTIFTHSWPKDDVEFEVRKVPCFSFSSWLTTISFALFLDRVLQKERANYDKVISFDRVFSTDIYRAGNACHRAWLNFRISHGSLKDRFSVCLNPLHWVINFLEKKLFADIEKNEGLIIVLSEQGKSQIQAYYPVSSDRFIVIPPIIDFQRFEGQQFNVSFRNKMRSKWEVEDKTVLLHVGSGFKIKGLDATIRALAHLRKTHPEVVLFVVGKDKRGEVLCRSLVDKVGVLDYVYFVGAQKDVGGFFALADVFVLPSLFETFGAVVIEALSFGLPVVVGEGAGVSSMIKDPETGGIVSSPATEQDLFMVLESQLKFLAENKERNQTLKNRQNVVRSCAPDVVVGRYLDLVQ